MFIGEVIGNVWGVQKVKELDGKRLLLVRAIDPVTEKPIGEAMMAIDTVGAGPGSIVLVMDEGGSARSVLDSKTAPVRTIICGIVDSVSMKGRDKKFA
ncbi:MAG: EutN/CcmL family microcompartment protein [Elusimicrobia bacterium]|nr:EutN/CcmL family microcompartment protein [Elusimicrobiota bacterium]